MDKKLKSTCKVDFIIDTDMASVPEKTKIKRADEIFK